MKWMYGVAVGLFALLGAFYALNTYIYNEKQGERVQFSDGEHLGFIHTITDNNTAMDFDDAVWLMGKVAEDAAIEAGFCTEETRVECLPNDYFIHNEKEKDVRLVIDSRAIFFLQTWQMPERGEVAKREISLSDFAALINDPTLHWSKLPYTITIKDGIVTRIEEVYIP